MATERARSRCRERLERLADSTQDSESLRREAIAELRRAIGFGRWCAALIDPDTLIGHTGIAETDHLAEMQRMQLHDARLHEANTGYALASSRNPVGLLSAATDGDLARSRRWRESLERYGTGDELRLITTDDRGSWGRFDLWRDAADKPFDAGDAQLARDASAILGRALRRATVVVDEHAPAAPLETGVLLLGPDLRINGTTPAASAWFRVLNPARMPYPGGIPSLVWSVVGRLIAAEHGEHPERPARIRVRAADGSWAVIDAARLDGGNGTLAVTVHAAGFDEVLSLLVRAFGLSKRETELVTLLVEGLDTQAISQRLFISRYTVQDHLKSIFEKIGVHSRLELLSRVLAQARPTRPYAAGR